MNKRRNKVYNKEQTLKKGVGVSDNPTPNNNVYANQLQEIEALQRRIEAEKNRILSEVGIDNRILKSVQQEVKASFVDDRPSYDNRKSILEDPFSFSRSFGYKSKSNNLSYELLRGMVAKTPIIQGILRTRKEQVANFLKPQSSKYGTGFIVRKKPKFYFLDKSSSKNDKISAEDERTIEYITKFIMNCGANNSWEADDFDSFGRKWVDDSLTFDQSCFEVVRNRRKLPVSFFMVDSATIRIADSYDDQEYKNFLTSKNTNAAQQYMKNVEDKKLSSVLSKFTNKVQVSGYYPSYVQIINGQPIAEFYPWEMSFSTRNPTTDIRNNGYGVSELEVLVNTITAMIWSEEYNRKFFSQGSAPKGFLKLKGTTGVDKGRIEEFKQSWRLLMSGVENAHKTPILEADADWNNLQNSSKDMEFVHWHEFLIRVSCMMFCIDPSEIGFNLGNMSGQRAMFEGNNEASIKHSQDKGLKPLINKLQSELNKYVVSQIDDDFELLFVGLEGGTVAEELEEDIKKLGNFMTLNEIRAKQGLDELKEEEGGNLILNSIFFQFQTQQQMQQQQEQQAQQEQGQDDGGGEQNQEDNGDSNDEQQTEDEDVTNDPYR